MPHPLSLSWDPPAAKAEPSSSPKLAHLFAPERRQKEKIPLSGHPLFLALSKNLFKEALQEEDIFLNSLSGVGLLLPCGATSETLPPCYNS